MLCDLPHTPHQRRWRVPGIGHQPLRADPDRRGRHGRVGGPARSEAARPHAARSTRRARRGRPRGTRPVARGAGRTLVLAGTPYVFETPTSEDTAAVVSWKDVVAFATGLPEVEESTSYNTPALKVNGKSFARLRTEAEGGLEIGRASCRERGEISVGAGSLIEKETRG